MVLSKIPIRRSLHTSAPLCRGAVSQPGWYPRDHMPGPYPRNEEERRAAAIKYGLRPEDYKPHHPLDFVNHIGDYPEIGVVTYEQRDPYDNYSHTMHRRNWNEPVSFTFCFCSFVQFSVPRQFTRYRYDRWSYTGLDEENYEPKDVLRTLLVYFVPVFLLAYWLIRTPEDPFYWFKQKYEPVYRPRVMPRQYPYDYFRAWPFEEYTKYPVLNYTFEPADEGFDPKEAEAKHSFNETSRVPI
ncbi:hypothetical protein niasHS_013542 [Heterodera schachtii]|uniref:Uncharacterized protein n=1 Tax=Heterodera schachtii TaxID=97005 RepID=A0ABD2IFJ6_HETSC